MSEKKRTRFYTKEEIEQAKTVDIYDFLQSHGKGQLQGGGRYPKYQINGHRSLVIDRKNNYFFHNSTHRGDTIISLLEEYEGYSFLEAVGTLLGEETTTHVPYEEDERDIGPYQPAYTPVASQEKGRTYLETVRGIDSEIVDYLFDQGYIVQGKEYDNLIFQWREQGLATGAIVGATALTTPQTVSEYQVNGAKKYIAQGSKKQAGFSVTLGCPKKQLFFESHVDMLSYWSLNKDLADCRLTCLEGLKRQVITNTVFESYTHFDQLPEDGLFFGVDNDPAGQRLVDYAMEHARFAKDSSGEVADIHNLTPTNTHIPQQHFDLYQEISSDYLNVSWELLATIHKVETNLSETNKLANEFSMYGFLAEKQPENGKERVIDIRRGLVAAAEAIEQKELTIQTLDQLYSDNTDKQNHLYYRKEKLTDIYTMYHSGTYKVVDEVGKDWSDSLKNAQAHGLDTRKIPLVVGDVGIEQVNARTKQQFSYYLQDDSRQDKLYEQLVDTYGINPDIVTALVNKGMLRQESNQRVVYLWNDRGEVVGGQLRGTFFDKKAFGKAGYEQKVMDHSRTDYGFNVTVGSPDKITFFQTPEDLLSYWTLHADTVKDTVLFALSETTPAQVAQVINHKLETGEAIRQVEICVGNNSAGMGLLDGVAQLETFDPEKRTLATDKGTELGLLSLRPKIGVTWLEELSAKRARQERVKEYQAHQQKEHYQAQQQAQVVQANYSRG